MTGSHPKLLGKQAGILALARPEEHEAMARQAHSAKVQGPAAKATISGPRPTTTMLEAFRPERTVGFSRMRC